MAELTSETVFSRLLDFLEQLEAANIHYGLHHVRDSLMVRAYVPSGLWEIEFFADGSLEIEHFARADGVDTASPEWLDQFIAKES